MRYIFLVLLLAPKLLTSQSSSGIEIGFTGGTTLYSGDLSGKISDYTTKDLGYTGGIFIRNNLSNHFGLRFSLQLAHIKGDELNRSVPIARALNFYNNLKQTNLMGEWKIININLDGGNMIISPFVAGGATFQISEPYFRDLTYGSIPLRMLGTEGQGIAGYPDFYKPTVLSLPAGAGLSITLNRRFTITAEVIGNRVFGDYIDDVSSAPVIMNDLLANPRGTSLALNAYISNPVLYPNPSSTPYTRGGPAVDWYYLMQFTFSYRIKDRKSAGKGNVSCPTF